MIARVVAAASALASLATALAAATADADPLDEIGFGAAASAMANARAAVATGAEAAHGNPAGLARIDRAELLAGWQYSHERLQLDGGHVLRDGPDRVPRDAEREERVGSDEVLEHHHTRLEPRLDGVERRYGGPGRGGAPGTLEARFAERTVGRALGAVDFISKPVDADLLRAKVMVFVEMSRKEAQLRREAREAVAASRALSTAVIEGTADIVTVRDAAGRGGARVYWSWSSWLPGGAQDRPPTGDLALNAG